jgi:hypothetical protein
MILKPAQLLSARLLACAVIGLRCYWPAQFLSARQLACAVTFCAVIGLRDYWPAQLLSARLLACAVTFCAVIGLRGHIFPSGCAVLAGQYGILGQEDIRSGHFLK